MQLIMYNRYETNHTWQKLFQYNTDCRPEITKTVMGQEKGKSTYSVYPRNASIIDRFGRTFQCLLED